MYYAYSVSLVYSVKLYILYRFIKEHIAELQELFYLDPYLVCGLLYVCPRQDIPLLCHYVPLGLMFGIMGHNIPSACNANIKSWQRTEVSSILSYML